MALFLLHGAIGAAAQLDVLKAAMTHQEAEVFTFNFPGHGGVPAPAQGYRIPAFARALLDEMDRLHLKTIDVIGYSMGGYVALWIARHHPERIRKILTIGTKLHWNAAIAEKESGLLDPEKILIKVPRFAEDLERLHAPLDWKMVLRETAAMMRDLGNQPALIENDFRQIQSSCVLTLGDQDTMVTREETETVVNWIPQAKFMLLENTPHPIAKLQPERIVEIWKTMSGN